MLMLSLCSNFSCFIVSSTVCSFVSCYQVLNILTSSRELLDLIKNVNTVFHAEQSRSSKSKLHSLYRFVPTIREQLEVCSSMRS